MPNTQMSKKTGGGVKRWDTTVTTEIGTVVQQKRDKKSVNEKKGEHQRQKDA